MEKCNQKIQRKPGNGGKSNKNRVIEKESLFRGFQQVLRRPKFCRYASAVVFLHQTKCKQNNSRIYRQDRRFAPFLHMPVREAEHVNAHKRSLSRSKVDGKQNKMLCVCVNLCTFASSQIREMPSVFLGFPRPLHVM